MAHFQSLKEPHCTITEWFSITNKASHAISELLDGTAKGVLSLLSDWSIWCHEKRRTWEQAGFFFFVNGKKTNNNNYGYTNQQLGSWHSTSQTVCLGSRYISVGVWSVSIYCNIYSILNSTWCLCIYAYPPTAHPDLKNLSFCRVFILNDLFFIHGKLCKLCRMSPCSMCV